MKTICVFCAASEVEKKYIDATVELGELMAKNSFDLVWGGSNHGLMKVIADSVQENGGKVFGVTMEFIKAHRRMNTDEMIIAKDLPERKKLLLSKSSAIILLVGGIGSLDEVAEMLEFKKKFKNCSLKILLQIPLYSFFNWIFKGFEFEAGKFFINSDVTLGNGDD